MLIASLTYYHGAAFSGEYRIRAPHSCIARNGVPYASFELGDMSGSLKSYMWLDKHQTPPGLSTNSRVSVCAQLRYLNGGWIAIVHAMENLDAKVSDPVALLPVWICPSNGLLAQLHDVINTIENEPFRGLLDNIFSDDAIALPFLAAPGSTANHHGYAGGLLEHSVECAVIINHMPLFPIETRDLGVVAALLHDVGKIRTLSPTVKLSHEGFLLNHDALTLEILAPHLKCFDSVWPDAAIALRYLLTWRSHRRKRHPLMTIAEAIASADRISSSLNKENAAFSQLPLWRNATEGLFDNGFWRPRPFLSNTPNEPSRHSLAS